jgi:hypothetical protein
MNNRRRFLMALGGFAGLAAIRPRPAVRAGLSNGILDSTGRRTEPYYVAFDQRLRELGFAEGRNLVIEFRTHGGPN